MAASAALLGYGTTVAIATLDSPADFVELGEVVDVTPPNAQIEQVDVTHMQSPDRVREFIAGLTDYGSMTLSMNYIPGGSTDDLILEWRSSGANRYVQITYPSTASPRPTDTFLGFIEGYETSATVADKMSATLTIKVAGAVTRAG
jgi:hypothetical protein